MPEGNTTGAHLEDVRIGPDAININFDRDALPTNEAERRQWMTRQIHQLNNALLGSERYGVNGLIDTVRRNERNQRIWLIILTAMVLLVLVILVRQQFQIGQILHEISILTRIP